MLEAEKIEQMLDRLGRHLRAATRIDAAAFWLVGAFFSLGVGLLIAQLGAVRVGAGSILVANGIEFNDVGPDDVGVHVLDDVQNLPRAETAWFVM